jgi:hypothetical protein
MPTLIPRVCGVANGLKLNKRITLFYVTARKYTTQNKFSDKKGLPTVITHPEALDRYNLWASQLWFAPRGRKKLICLVY